MRWLNILSQLTFDSNKKLQKIAHSHFDAILHMMHKFQVCFGNVDEKYNQNQKKIPPRARKLNGLSGKIFFGRCLIAFLAIKLLCVDAVDAVNAVSWRRYLDYTFGFNSLHRLLHQAFR